MTPPAWLTKTVARILGVVAIVLLVGALLFLRQCSAERTAKTETKLATGQAGAALQSGQDAVGSTGAVEANSSAGDALTKENTDAIQNAQGAREPVAAPVGDAFIASLCRRASYRLDPKCLQHPPAH